MAQKNTEQAERVSLVHSTRGTRITVGAALASRMSGYKPDDKAKSTAALEGEPSESWTVKQLTEYAETNHIDLAGATRKGDILDVLASVADPDNIDQDDEDDDLDGPADDE